MKKIFRGVQKDPRKKGFTLLELMIVMAIMLLFITFIFGTFYIVNASHARVAVLDDAKELAALDMNAIENLIINGNDIEISDDPTARLGYTVITFNSSSNPGQLTYNNNGTDILALGPFQQYTIKTSSGGSIDKWAVTAKFDKTMGNAVDVTVTLTDNSTHTPYYRLTKTIFLLNVEDAFGSQIADPDGETTGVTGNTIKCKSTAW